MFFAGNVRSADGRARRADPSGFMAFFLVLFLSQKEKERKKKEEKPAKIFAGKPRAADGRARRADPSGFTAFALVLFSPPERKENEVKQNGTEQRVGIGGGGPVLPLKKCRTLSIFVE